MLDNDSGWVIVVWNVPVLSMSLLLSCDDNLACNRFIRPDGVCPIILLRTVAVSAIGCDADCWCCSYCIVIFSKVA